MAEQSVIPYLTVKGGADAIAFYQTDIYPMTGPDKA
jgi:hypothetical protein